MKLNIWKFLIFSISLFCYSSIFSQVFWTESFGDGCNQGIELNGYASANGSWNVVSTGNNDADANVWYVSATASFAGLDNCVEGCVSNPAVSDQSLHIGKAAEDVGAFYATDGAATTSLRAESPTIDCSSYCSIELSFDFIHGGVNQDGIKVLYFDGSDWITLSSSVVKTDECVSGAVWDHYTINLPPSSSFNNDVKIGFEWQNGASGSGDEVSFAVDNITLLSNDAENPFISCPAQLNAYISGSGCSAEVPNIAVSSGVQITDNCSEFQDLTFSQSPTAGTSLSNHLTSTNVILIVTDEAGNSNTCQVEVVAVDTIGPEIDCPTLDNIYASASCFAHLDDYTTTISITDNCSASNLISFEQFPAPNFMIDDDQQVIITAEDAYGNSSTCSFMVVLEDTIRPSISCPGVNQTQPAQDNSCDGLLGDFTSGLVWSDNCTSDINLMTFEQVPQAGTVVTGTFPVELIVTDEAGNENSCSISVTVEDLSGPVLFCPSDTLLIVNASCEYTTPNLLPVVNAIDNCSPQNDISFAQSPLVGVPADWSEPVVITATDGLGNTSTCEVAIVPQGINPPEITCPADKTVDNGVDCDYILPDYTDEVIVSFECGQVEVTQFPAPGTMMTAGEHTITFVAAYGGESQINCSTTLTIIENSAPTITCPSNISSCESLVTYDAPVIDDNCSGAVLEQVDLSGLTSGDVFPIGVTTQTYIVTDLSGNSANCSFEVEVIDAPNGATIITPNTSLCDTTSMVVEAEIVASGTGEWKVISGTGSFNNQFAPITGVNNLSLGENVIVWEVNLPECGSFSSSDTLVITVYQLPFPASNQDTQYNCGDEEFILSANTPNVGEGLWYATTTSPVFSDETAPNSTVSGLEVGWNELVWQISNGSCPISRDTLALYYKPNAEIFTQDTSICVTENELLLTGSAFADPMTNVWSFVEGAGNFEDQLASQTLVSSLSGGVNKIILSQNHHFCGISRDTVSVSVELCEEYDPTIPTLFTPNNDGKNDLFILEDLAVLYPNCEVQIVNRWGNVVYESVGYANPWDGTLRNEGEPVPLGTYFYRIDLNGEANDIITGSISVVR